MCCVIVVTVDLTVLDRKPSSLEAEFHPGLSCLGDVRATDGVSKVNSQIHIFCFLKLVDVRFL